MNRLWIATVIVAALSLPAPASAETATACTAVIASLPTVIASRGVYCLDGDLATVIDSGTAISVQSDRVTIDCRGYTITGGGDTSRTSIGVHASGRAMITVRDCGVEHFGTGIRLDADAVLVEGNRVHDNVAGGIRVAGDGNLVRDNAVTGTGYLYSLLPAISAIHAQGGTDVVGNVVQALNAGETTAEYGIRVVNGLGAVVVDNFVKCTSRFDRSCTGIHAGGSGLVVQNNRLVAGDVAIRCTSGQSSIRGNSAYSFTTFVVGCVDDGGNTIH